ncbi:kinase-like domain-containing protein [Suillus lakei]|nr:kinase-like domain-containing protein [Suillus lakei]
MIDGGIIWSPLLRCGCLKTTHKLARPQLIIEAKVTQKVVTPPSSEFYGASSDAPGTISIPINISISDLYSDQSVHPYPSDAKSDPPASNDLFTFTPSGTAEAPTPQISPLPSVYGSFRVWCLLAEGVSAMAMGAEDIASNRLICLKVFRKDRLKYGSTEKVLLNELEVYKRLASSTPCPAGTFVMGLEKSFQTEDEICFAMELMASDLHNYMMYRSAYCLDHACRWTAQLALGINALHELGIIHRDIKAENILIDIRENVRIADFGLSYVNADKGPLEPQRAYAAGVVGTMHCMAPEILHSRANPASMKYGAPVDWWALGCVVYELVSKRHQALFVSEDEIMYYVSWRSSSDTTYNQFPAFEGFPQNTADLITGLLEPDPFLRYRFREVTDHEYFLHECGASEFSDACSRALHRQELPDLLPDLRFGRETHTAAIWDPLPSSEYPRVANVDWIKPPCVSFS